MTSSNPTSPPTHFFRDGALSLLHRIVAIPAIYDLAQWMAGSAISHRILREEFARLPVEANTLDVGGGTGRLRPLLPPTWKYTCVDIDPQKLDGFRKKFPRDNAVQSSATSLPFPDASFDLVFLCSVSHHLTDTELAAALAEISRVLTTQGRLLFHDALHMPHRFRSRMLWAVDRGSTPRAFEKLVGLVGRQFQVDRELRYDVHHSYVFWTLQKLPPGRSATAES